MSRKALEFQVSGAVFGNPVASISPIVKVNPLKGGPILMRKLLSLLFGSILVFTLAMPAFAQDTGTQEAPKAEKKTKTAKAKAKGKKTKKEKAAKKTEEAPKQ